MADGSSDSALRRLEQAHQLWHQALSSYPDVDEFVTNVNALIPSLRSVTWVLQKALASRPGFREWYAVQQDAMKADDVMRWLVDARNHIEKVGDLELRSTARVSIIAGWHQAPFKEADVPPLLPPEALASALAGGRIPDRVRREGVLQVERRWVSNSLPAWELLDACAHSYAFLDGLLREAVIAFDGGRPGRQTFLRLPCMVAGPEARTALLHLQSGHIISLQRSPHSYDSSDEARVEAKYGEVVRAAGRPGNSLSGRVKWYHDIGRGMLLKDGHHRMLAFVIREGRPVQQVALDAEDQQEKYILMEALAGVVRATGADEVIVTGEVWLAPFLPSGATGADLRAGEREDKEEAFSTYGLSRDGSSYSLFSFMIRTDQGLELEHPSADKAPISQTLLPVWRAWHGAGSPPPWARS